MLDPEARPVLRDEGSPRGQVWVVEEILTVEDRARSHADRLETVHQFDVVLRADPLSHCIVELIGVSEAGLKLLIGRGGGSPVVAMHQRGESAPLSVIGAGDGDPAIVEAWVDPVRGDGAMAVADAHATPTARA